MASRNKVEPWYHWLKWYIHLPKILEIWDTEVMNFRKSPTETRRYAWTGNWIVDIAFSNRGSWQISHNVMKLRLSSNLQKPEINPEYYSTTYFYLDRNCELTITLHDCMRHVHGERQVYYLQLRSDQRLVDSWRRCVAEVIMGAKIMT